MDMDFSCMHDVATSIMTIQETYGVIPNIYSKGECAKVKTGIQFENLGILWQ